MLKTKSCIGLSIILVLSFIIISFSLYQTVSASAETEPYVEVFYNDTYENLTKRNSFNADTANYFMNFGLYYASTQQFPITGEGFNTYSKLVLEAQ